MDQGNSSSHEESNFVLYDDAYGADMDDDVDGAFLLGGWDHQGPGVAAAGSFPPATVTGAEGYGPPTTMDDFQTTHYGQEYQHNQAFEQGGQQFPEFMGQEHMGDQQSVNDGFGISAMDMYHTPTIYPNLAQETMEYGIRPGIFNSDAEQAPSMIPENNPNNPNQLTLDSNDTSSNSSIRPAFKFSTEQKQIMMDKFNAGLHYPTNPEKDALAQMFGVASESVHPKSLC
jgi:hypothetical protein